MIHVPPNRRVFVYGASGHGKVVADIMLANRVSLAGFIDDNRSSEAGEILGLKILGDGSWLADQAKSGPVAAVFGIGDNFAREKIARRCLQNGIQLLTAVHPAAIVAASAQIGLGTVIMAGAVINPDAHVGEGVIVNTGATVEHDCRVGNFAHLSPNACMGGCARLGDFSWLGIGATIIHGVGVGCRTIVGAGAVVVRDLPDEIVAMGVPAHVHRHLNRREAEIKH